MTTTSSLMWEKNSRSVFILKSEKEIEKITSIKRRTALCGRSFVCWQGEDEDRMQRTSHETQKTKTCSIIKMQERTH